MLRPGSACLLLLLVSTLAAAAQAEGLQATQAGWADGITQANALGLRDLTEDGAFQMTAESLHIRIEQADHYAQVPPLVVYAIDPNDANEDLHDVQIASSEVRPGFLFVMPVPGAPLVLTGGCLDAVAAAAPDHIQAPSQIYSQNTNPHVATKDAVAFHPCAPVSLCGALEVILWEWDVSASSAEGSKVIQSGVLASSSGQDTRPVLGRAQQVYLSTMDGCLSFIPSRGTEVFADAVTVTGASSIRLRDAVGSVADTMVQARDVEVQGNLQARFMRGTDAQHPLLVEGLLGATSLQADGRAMPMTVLVNAPSATDSDGSGTMAWVALAASVAVVGAGLVLARPPRAWSDRFLALAVENGSRDRDRRAMFWAGRAVRADPGLADGHVLRAYLQALRGDLDAALASRERADESMGDDARDERALNALEAAWVAHRSGDAAGRRRWLEAAFRANPTFAALKLLEPDKAELRPWGIEFAKGGLEGYT